jgi:hypothetical protein
MHSYKEEMLTVFREKWGGEFDQRLCVFFDNFDSWLDQIPTAHRPTVMTLIKNLDYYSHNTVNDWLKQLHLKLLEHENISIDNTIYVFIKSKYGITNSSNDYWMDYKFINRLNTNTCVENMDAIKGEEWDCIRNIVFIDDFSGSGDSLINELKKHPKRYRGKTVYFMTINIMFTAMNNLRDYSKENGIEIIFISAFMQRKAFDRGLFGDEITAKDEIDSMSKRIGIPGKEIMGFKESQALVAFYNNTPNNTLGFIRYNTDGYTAPFPRKDDEMPVWRKMQKDRHRRNNAKYRNKCKEV